MQQINIFMTELYLGTVQNFEEPVKIPASLLSKHVAILGSIGSGKTVAAKVLLEEATLAGIPSIVIDPQGDIAKMASKEPQSVLEKNGVDLERVEMLDSTVEYSL
jgi:DNA helicase HerA-like ATPase